jgi:diguanylate cyclase (GGDEF)-like protein
MRDPGGIVTYLLGLNAIAFITWVISHGGSPESRATISDLIFLPTGLASTLLAWRASRHSSISTATRRAWTLLAAAFAALWAGDVLFAYYELVLKTTPFPSVADAGYLLFYPLVLTGLSSFPAAPQSPQERTTFWLDTITVLLGGWMVVWYVVLGPTTVGSDAPLLEKALSAGYPIGDLVLIFGIATVILRRPEAASRGPLVVFAVALAFFLIADLSYGYLAPLDRYASGDWPDAIWILAQFGFVLSAQYQHWRASHEPTAPPALSIDPHHVSSLPYGAIALGYLLLIFSTRNMASYPFGGLVFGAVAITAVVLTRQLLLLRELRSLAVTDGLTSLPTRQHFTALAAREFARTIRYGRSLAAMLIDVDGFKSINDRYGHAVGDEVLRVVARRMRETLRQIDMLGRYGGDEFVVVLPETTEDGAVSAAQRLVAAVAASQVMVRGERVPITVSAGVAIAKDAADLPGLLHHADEALYRAKAAGRDRVVAFSAGHSPDVPPPTPPSGPPARFHPA